MSCWLRFEADGAERFGTLSGDTIAEREGDMFGASRETGRRFALSAVRPRRSSLMTVLSASAFTPASANAFPTGVEEASTIASSSRSTVT